MSATGPDLDDGRNGGGEPATAQGGEPATAQGGEGPAPRDGVAQPDLSPQEQAGLLAEERARRARWQAATGAVAALLVMVVAAWAVISYTGGDDETSAVQPEASSVAAAPETPAGGAARGGVTADEAAVIKAATTVPATVLDQVGRGQVGAEPVRVSGQPALTEGGKPVILYVGAEYCPYCASQRWAVVVALSRFGTFGQLDMVEPVTDDSHPSIPTFTFHGATYTSEYLVFQGVETATNIRQVDGYAPLDTLSPQQEQIMNTLNGPPYVPADSAGGIPFLDFGNRYLLVGSSYDVETLLGKSGDLIAASLSRPADPIAQGVHGAANLFTALICQLTGGKPGQVCESAAVRAYANVG